MRLSGNTIFITGATSGIGRSMAEEFHRRGNLVLISGRRREILDEMLSANPGMRAFELDVSDSDSVHAVARIIQTEFPELNILVNNAGIMRPEDYTDDPVDTSIAQATLSTNISGVIQLTALLLPILRKQASATLITTTSGLAFLPMAAYPTYCATKAFLHSWLTSLRHQLRKSSVEVLELVPPYVQTELTGPTQARDPKAMPLEGFVDEVFRLLSEAKSNYGEILVERVKPLRWAERDGNFDALFAALNP